MRIKLSEERRATLVEAVRAHFRDRHDDDIGELKAALILEFFVARLGPAIYNQAIGDAHAFLRDKLIDLEGEFYEPEENR